MHAGEPAIQVLATPIKMTDGRIRTCYLPGTPGRSTIEVTRIFTTGNMLARSKLEQ
jgi:hypothetical protein